VGFRFRKRVRLFKGAWINLYTQGGYLSIGGHGFATDVSKEGVRETVSAPGPVFSRMKAPTRHILLILGVIAITSCASISVTKIGTATHARLAEGAKVAVFTSESEVQQPFVVVGNISYNNPGKYQRLDLDDAIEPLKEKARLVGGNAIIIDKSHPIKPGTISTTGIYVEARAIQLTHP